MANQGRRKTDKIEDPGWYRSIPVNTTGWPTCSRCGVKTAVVDHVDHECLRCQLEHRKTPQKERTPSQQRSRTAPILLRAVLRRMIYGL